MDNRFYPMIFRRKSFHLFRGVGEEHFNETELQSIQSAFVSFESLYPEIHTAIRIVPSSVLGVGRGAEYCILLYSERKQNYLMNIGYLGEQLDLYLVEKGIGSLWLGFGKPDVSSCDGLDYVIMLAIHKVSAPTLFRKDMFQARRKPLPAIWQGDTLEVGEIVRFAPSACNSQPWLVKKEDSTLLVYRYRKQSRVGLLSPKKAFYYNRIDIGIFLCFLEICLAEKKIGVSRELFPDEEDREYSLVAAYTLEEKP